MYELDWLSAIAIVVSSIAAILAWTAKLLWSKEYKEATNRLIQAKDAENAALKTQIQTLLSFTPDRLRQIFEATKDILESEIERLKEESQEKDKEIEQLMTMGKEATEKIKALDRQRVENQGGIIYLENVLSAIDNTTRYYLDIGKLFADHDKAKEIMERLRERVKSVSEAKKINLICLLDEAGPYGPLLLGGQLFETTGIPTIRVSRNGRIIGEVNSGDKILFIDSILITGHVFKRTMQLMRHKGADVVHGLFFIVSDAGRRFAKIPVDSVLSASEIAQLSKISEQPHALGRS